MKRNKKIVIAIVIIIAIIAISAIPFVIYNNSKTDENEAKKDTTNQTTLKADSDKLIKKVENENVTVHLGDVAKTDKYLIIEYDVDVTEEDEKTNTTVGDQVSFQLPRTIQLGTKKIITMDDVKKRNREIQLAYKIDDYQVKVYDVIDISNMKLTGEKMLSIDVMDPYYNYDDEEYDENEARVGTLKKELDQTDLEEKAEVIEKNQTETEDNITTTVGALIGTDRAKFITGKITIKNVSEEHFNSIKGPTNIDINMLDENGDTILDVKKTGSLRVYDEKGDEIIDDFSFENVESDTFEINYLLGLFNDDRNMEYVKICPYGTNTTNIGRYINDKKAYSLEDQNNSEENECGGKVEVTKVKKEDEKITIYFTQTGFVDNQSMVIIKNDEDYATPDKIERIEGNKYKAEFDTWEYEYDQYVILENSEIQLIGNGIDVDIYIP